MTRHLHKIKRHAIRAGRAVVVFFAPVAESVRGQLCKEEWQRVAVKFTGTYMAGVSYKVITKDPTFYGDLVAPLVPATVIGFADAIRRLGHGTEPGTPDGPLPLASEPQNEAKS